MVNAEAILNIIFQRNSENIIQDFAEPLRKRASVLSNSDNLFLNGCFSRLSSKIHRNMDQQIPNSCDRLYSGELAHFEVHHLQICQHYARRIVLRLQEYSTVNMLPQIKHCSECS